MDIKINRWCMFDRYGELMWILDNLNLDVSDDELCKCIEDQIYNSGNLNKEIKNER